mgnify:CR=1 FL=1
MKFKTTKKDMKNGYYEILGIPYCDMQFLLYYYSPIAYSTRREGWACDYYVINGVCISTGYDHLDSKNMTCDYALIREYDKLAINKTKEERDQLLFELLDKLKK